MGHWNTYFWDTRCIETDQQFPNKHDLSNEHLTSIEEDSLSDKLVSSPFNYWDAFLPACLVSLDQLVNQFYVNKV